jgi:hypothetical protein
MRSQIIRNSVAAWLILGMAISTPAAAQSAPDSKVKAAYELAIKCFVASGHAYSNRLDANDQERADYFNTQAKHSWDVALRLSKQLGYSGEHFKADVKTIQERELPLMVKDAEYFTQTANECKAYGLM